MTDARRAQVNAVLAHDRKVRRRRWILRGFALLLLLAGAAYAYVRLTEPAPPTRYRTAPARLGTLQVVVTATGTLQARNSVEVGAEVTGRLVEVPVDFNDKVTPGQLLARIDPTPFELDVRQGEARQKSAVAAVGRAEASADEAKKTLARAEALAKEGLISRQDLDTARAAATRSRADVAAARASLAEAEAALSSAATRLSKTTIVAPIGGIVLNRAVELGQTVTAGFQTPVLFTLATDLAAMELRAAVDEADIGKVAEGQRATFTVDAYPARVFNSKVLRIRNVPTVNQNVVTYEAILDVTNDDHALRPGMTATASIVASRYDNTLLVPNEALRFTPPREGAPGGGRGGPGGLPFMMGPPRFPGGEAKKATEVERDPAAATVWVLVGGKPVARRIRKGDTDGDNTVVLAGELAAGDPVIVERETAQPGAR